MMERIGNQGRRSIGGMLLLVILAVCAYIGSVGDMGERSVSVAVVRSAYTMEETAQGSVQNAAQRLKAERNAQIDLLTSVAENESASEQTKADALSQLAQLARSMEAEAQVLACLSGMGINQAAAVCGAQAMTVMIGYEHMTNETERTRVIDAVCSITGFEPGDIEIILTKK